MIKDLKCKIQKLILEKDKKLVELGKVLKNNNTIELKKLESHTSLKLIEKEISQLKINLSKTEDNENKLKELYKKIQNYKENKKHILKTYETKLKKIIEIIINKYPNNLSSILEHKMNITKSILAKYKYRKTEIIKFNEKVNFLKKFMINIKLMLKAIINQINIKKIGKEFEKKILKEHLFSENLEKLVNEFIESKDLSREIIEEYKLMNGIQEEIIKISTKIKNKRTKENINNKNKIENAINIVQTNKEAILKKIAEEFVEMSKTEKGLNKSGAINSLLETIKKLNQQISKLNEDLVKAIKMKEIEKVQKRMQQLISNKESIENKLNTLNSKIETIKNEIDELDNK
ncbi:hypothetical protein [Borrelia miyamotoi]|uniref:Uncharacterized protein n=1 Tax=Borrelia miyamotoi TaxID=47466 RepID=A0AAQ2WW06_9SPIR|nr:hypothetical protein [Borrelia miyamotoi]AGT27207.1 hypothetical protein I871_01125 [Borrelia miyamotoi LB-2001]AJA58394.1 hypothetical protein RJ61_01015 [Borrelia miyamotoi]AOW95472.1 hypothetical protein AXH25_01025 [Borrelia miyamotoi]QTL83357.1 hypothetical protein bmLB2001_000202 [Borrelia miyamotoi]WAZ85347.1 hypothetical protein O5400_03250 [Borrelia miyamotoi]